jgi:hypothetical protein
MGKGRYGLQTFVFLALKNATSIAKIQTSLIPLFIAYGRGGLASCPWVVASTNYLLNNFELLHFTSSISSGRQVLSAHSWNGFEE